MKDNFKFVVLFLGVVVAADCGATWYFNESASNEASNKYILENSAHTFKLSGMNCGVNPTEYRKKSDGSSIETRKLYCWPAGGVYVSVVVTCDHPKDTYSTLFISRNGKSYDPLLTCGPDM